MYITSFLAVVAYSCTMCFYCIMMTGNNQWMRGQAFIRRKRAVCYWVLQLDLVWRWLVNLSEQAILVLHVSAWLLVLTQTTPSSNWWSIFSHCQMSVSFSAKGLHKIPLRTYLGVAHTKIQMCMSSRRKCKPYELLMPLAKDLWGSTVGDGMRSTKRKESPFVKA